MIAVSATGAKVIDVILGTFIYLSFIPGGRFLVESTL